MSQVAYVDESCRQRAADCHAYALASVAVAAPDADVIRDVLKQLRSAKNPTVHWRNESPARRNAIVRSIRMLSLHSVVAVCLHETKPERARRACLTRLFWELGERATRHVVIESRREQRDQHDRALLTGLRRSGGARRDMLVEWARPKDEELLWLPDAVAGAVTWWLGDDRGYLEELGDLVELISVDEP
jgi:hypothetical protein